MRELINDPFYETIREYKDCILDYVLMEDDNPHQGRRSHWDAVLFAMLKLIERYLDYQLKAEISLSVNLGRNAVLEDAFPWSLDMEKAKSHPINAASLFFVPKITHVDYYGNRFYEGGQPEADGGQIPYWYAFLEPPHGTAWVIRNGKKIRKQYGPEDFETVNHALFPQGTDELEVYEWTTDWSNHFDAGHEWWGAACWTVYDKKMNRYTVIMASYTD